MYISMDIYIHMYIYMYIYMYTYIFDMLFMEKEKEKNTCFFWEFPKMQTGTFVLVFTTLVVRYVLFRSKVCVVLVVKYVLF